MTAKINKEKTTVNLSLDIGEFLFLTRLIGSTNANKLPREIEGVFDVEIDDVWPLFDFYNVLYATAKVNGINLREK